MLQITGEMRESQLMRAEEAVVSSTQVRAMPVARGITTTGASSGGKREDMADMFGKLTWKRESYQLLQAENKTVLLADRSEPCLLGRLTNLKQACERTDSQQK